MDQAFPVGARVTPTCSRGGGAARKTETRSRRGPYVTGYRGSYNRWIVEVAGTEGRKDILSTVVVG